MSTENPYLTAPGAPIVDQVAEDHDTAGSDSSAFATVPASSDDKKTYAMPSLSVDYIPKIEDVDGVRTLFFEYRFNHQHYRARIRHEEDGSIACDVVKNNGDVDGQIAWGFSQTELKKMFVAAYIMHQVMGALQSTGTEETPPS